VLQRADSAEPKTPVELIALGRADMSSVAAGWGFDADAKLPELREWAIGQLANADEDDGDD
jgi:hypothetical protein